jgi:hypothetical protein
MKQAVICESSSQVSPLIAQNRTGVFSLKTAGMVNVGISTPTAPSRLARVERSPVGGIQQADYKLAKTIFNERIAELELITFQQ